MKEQAQEIIILHLQGASDGAGCREKSEKRAVSGLLFYVKN